MIWKALLSFSIVAVLIGTIWWVKDGCQIFTKDKEEVVTEKVDPLFGTTVRTSEWKDNFRFGLLPDDDSVAFMPRSLAFTGGLALGVSLLSIVMIRREKRQRKS